ncbi:MAG: 2-thiouracil desulfurase family protein [Acidiferrobacterales bacterium]
MESVLVSACLLGQAVRYDGADQFCNHPILQRWSREGRIVAVCPEVAGGLPVPRPRSEIAAAADSMSVLAGTAKVIDASGRDVSEYFIRGAGRALELAQAKNIRIAILKDGSPSCGTSVISDGTFTGTRIPAPGVTAARLCQAGIRVFSEDQITEADAFLQTLETAD